MIIPPPKQVESLIFGWNSNGLFEVGGQLVTLGVKVVIEVGFEECSLTWDNRGRYGCRSSTILFLLEDS